MSKMSCFRKTNKQMFGWIPKIMPRFRDNSVMHIAIAIVVLLLEFMVGVSIAIETRLMSVVFVTALVCTFTAIYSITLYENCNSDEDKDHE